MIRIPIYAPNLSSQTLGSLLLESMGPKANQVSVGPIQEKVAFRAPTLVVGIQDTSLEFVIIVLFELLQAARLLGGTQFVFRAPQFGMRQRNIDIAPQKLLNLLIACEPKRIEQLDIF